MGQVSVKKWCLACVFIALSGTWGWFGSRSLPLEANLAGVILIGVLAGVAWPKKGK